MSPQLNWVNSINKPNKNRLPRQRPLRDEQLILDWEYTTKILQILKSANIDRVILR